MTFAMPDVRAGGLLLVPSLQRYTQRKKVSNVRDVSGLSFPQNMIVRNSPARSASKYVHRPPNSVPSTGGLHGIQIARALFVALSS